MLDTSVLVTYMDRGEPGHDVVVRWLDALDEAMVTTPLALAEMDYLVTRFGGAPAAALLRRSVGTGAFAVAWWGDALPTTLTLADARPHLGLTDASLVALAAHLRTTRIATLDERHFRPLRPLTGEEAFTLLPTDAV